MNDLEKLLEAEAKLTSEPWTCEGSGPRWYLYGLVPGGRPNGEGIARMQPTIDHLYSNEKRQEDGEALVFIRNHLRPALERAQRIEEAARAALETLEPQFSHWGCTRALRTALAQGSEDG